MISQRNSLIRWDVVTGRPLNRCPLILSLWTWRVNARGASLLSLWSARLIPAAAFESDSCSGIVDLCCLTLHHKGIAIKHNTMAPILGGLMEALEGVGIPQRRGGFIVSWHLCGRASPCKIYPPSFLFSHNKSGCFILFPLSSVSVCVCMFQGHEEIIRNDGLLTIY